MTDTVCKCEFYATLERVKHSKSLIALLKAFPESEITHISIKKNVKHICTEADGTKERND